MTPRAALKLPTPRLAGVGTQSKYPTGQMPCPASLRPLVDQLAGLKDMIESKIEHTLGNLQAENTELQSRLAAFEKRSKSTTSSLPVKEPKLISVTNGENSHDVGNADKAGLSNGDVCGKDVYTKPLEVGAYVMVKKLQTRSELNGQKGMLLEFNVDSGRWNVALRDGCGISVKAENLMREADDEGSSSGDTPGDVRQLMQSFIQQQAAIVQQALDDNSRQTMRLLAQRSMAFFEAVGSQDEKCALANGTACDDKLVEEVYEPINVWFNGDMCQGNVDKWVSSMTTTTENKWVSSIGTDENTGDSHENSERGGQRSGGGRKSQSVWGRDLEDSGRQDQCGNKISAGSKKDLPAPGSGQNNSDMKKCPFPDAAAMKDRVREAINRKPYNVMDFYWEEGFAQRIARSSIFDQITLVVIAFNALWIAIDTDLNDAEVLINAQPPFIVAENLFCVYFFFEWSVRFCAFQRKINGFKDKWFAFDSTLVFFMVMETWVMTVFLIAQGGGKNNGMGNASILRLVRLMRLTRMARMARLLRAMPELMILVKAILVAFRSVFFTLCLLLLIIYVFAIAFVQLTSETTESAVREDYFSGVLPAMYTLLLIGNMPDHSPFVEAVAAEDPVWAVVLAMFMFLGPLTVMGMLAGVLVEVVSVVSSVERETMVVTYVTEQLHRMLNEVDLDGDASLTQEEFQRLVVRPDAARMMASVGVDVIGLAEFCDFLFTDSEEISFASFMELVLQLRGTNQATVKDIVDMRKFMRQELTECVTVSFKDLENNLKKDLPKLTAQIVERMTAGRNSLLSAERISSTVNRKSSA